MRPIVRPLSALLAFAALLAPLATAAAADQAEDVAWRLEARSITLAKAGNGFTYSSARDTSLGDDLLSGAFQADPPRLDARLAARDPDEAAATLRLEWRELAEYRDADGDGRFGLADPVVQRVPLAGLPATTVVTPVLGGQSASVTYTLPGNGSGQPPLLPGERGTLRLAFTVVGSPSSIAGHALGPTDLGLDASVHDFPFQAGDSRLALVTAVSSTALLDATADAVGVTAGPLTFRVGWGDTRVDGVAQPAPATVVSGDGHEAQLVQSWPRGQAIGQQGSVAAQRWGDAGALLEALPPGDWRFFALGVAVVAVALGIPSLRRLRGSGGDRET